MVRLLIADETCFDHTELSSCRRAGAHLRLSVTIARRSRRFEVARSQALADYSKFLGLLTMKRPEGRAPRSRQLADAPAESFDTAPGASTSGPACPRRRPKIKAGAETGAPHRLFSLVAGPRSA